MFSVITQHHRIHLNDHSQKKFTLRTRQKNRQTAISLALAFLLGPVALPFATALTYTWNGSANENWSSRANWTLSGCGAACPNPGSFGGPSYADSVVFAGNQRLTTNHDNPNPDLSGRALQGISFAAGAGAFTINGNPLGLFAGGLANRSSNLQTVNTNLTLFADQVWDGGSAGLNVNAYLDMATYNLTLTNKAAINFSYHAVGGIQGNSTQSLTIQSGSSVTSTGGLDVGGRTVDGAVNVTGATSSLNVKGTLGLGDLVNGTLAVYSGAKVNVSVLELGRSGGRGTVEVSGAGSRLAVEAVPGSTGNLIATDGSLSFSQGATLSNFYAVIGNYAGVTASLNVRDAGSKLNVFNLNLGQNGGTGQLNISNGGEANIYNLAVSKDSSITLNGGRLSVVNVANAGTFNWNSGTVNYTADTAMGTGTLLGTDAVVKTGGTLLVAGNLTVPAQTRLTLVGGLVQPKKLTVEALGSVSIDGTSTLEVGSDGMDNRGSLTLAGGSLTGSGSIVNWGYLTGSGVIQSSLYGGFMNRGVFAQSGAIVLRTGVAENNGQWDITGGQGILLNNAVLYNNYGVLSLDGGTISASDIAGGDNSRFDNALNATFVGHGRITVPLANAGRIVVDAGALFVPGGLSNSGEILMTSNASVINGENGYFANNGRIQGQGKFRAIGVDNQGTVAAQGGTLTMAGFGNKTSGTVTVARDATLLASNGLANNYGKIQLAGGTFDNNGLVMSNESTGVISGYGDLRAGVLTNKGRVLMSGGTSSVYADVVGAAASKIILSGNSNTTFYGTAEFQSGSELRVSGGSVATFFELVQQRNGASFTGTGTKRFEGGLSVGNSPGLGMDEGDVEFGEGNVYLAEIGGITACTVACETDANFRDHSFDKYIVGGSLSFSGTLKLTSWNGFVGQAGQRYDLFDWGTTSGTFTSIDGTAFAIAPGTRLDFSSLYTTGEVGVVAVPEPGSWALFAAGLAALGGLTRQRRRSSQHAR